MLCQPGYYFIMLEIGTSGDIHDEKTKLLPMSEKNPHFNTMSMCFPKNLYPLGEQTFLYGTHFCC